MPKWYDQITPKFVQNAAVMYLQQMEFDAFAMFPVLPVKQKSGYIPIYKKEDWLRIGDINRYKRVGAVESVGDDYEVDKQPYVVEQFAFHKDVTEEEANEADSPFRPVQDAVLFVLNRFKLLTVANFVANYLKSGVWGTEVAGGADFTQWDQAASDPVADVLAWKAQVKSLTGLEPNRMLITYDVYAALRSNDSIKASLKVTDDKVVTRQVLARLFDLERLVIMDAVRTTAEKGETATSSNTGFFAEKTALLVYAPPRPSKYEPSAGYHIIERQYGRDVRTRRIPMPHLNDALRIEGEMHIDCKLVAADLGVYATDVLA